MRKALLVLAVLGQLSVLAVMVYGKESLVWTGERVYLQTAPIDPRDPFRGDFVRLRYPMNNLAHVELAIDDPLQSDVELARDQRVYAVLEPFTVNEPQAGGSSAGDSPVYEVRHVTNKVPQSGLFLRGRVSGAGTARQLPARFGIEQLFVQQGRGIEMEEKLGVRGGVQIPLEVELAVGSNGAATIVGHRFGQMGMQLEMMTAATQDNDSQPRNRFIGVSVSVVNVSDSVRLIPDPVQRCAWSLRPVLVHDPERFVEAHDCSAESSSVSMLAMQPGQSVDVEIRFDDERWFVLPAGNDSTSQSGAMAAGNLSQLAAGQLFRLVLQPPPASLSSDHANENHWRGKLYSQAFNGQGLID